MSVMAAKRNPWPKRLKALRAAVAHRKGQPKAITQTEAGELIGVSQNLWSAWERGTRTPDTSRQILISLLEQGKID